MGFWVAFRFKKQNTSSTFKLTLCSETPMGILRHDMLQQRVERSLNYSTCEKGFRVEKKGFSLNLFLRGSFLSVR